MSDSKVAFERIERQFASGNSIEVDRASIRQEDWQAIRTYVRIPVSVGLSEHEVSDLSTMEKAIRAFAFSASERDAKCVAALGDEPLIRQLRIALDARDPEGFDCALGFAVDRITSGVLSESGIYGKAAWLFEHAEFVERQFEEMYVRFEGRACCADKSRTVLRALARNLIHGVPIEFDFTQEYTFHLPKKVLNNEAAILAFFDALMALYQGRPEAYLDQLAQLMEPANTGQEEACQ